MIGTHDATRYATWFATLAIVAASLARAETARAAGFANTLQSGTSTAMGGVGVANADEGNLSYYNPALMTFDDGYQLYAGPTLIMPRTSYESSDGNTQTDAKKSLFPPPNVHAAYAFTDDLSAGIGLTLPYGLAIEWPDDWVGRENIQFQQLQTYDINPNIAYRIPDTGLSLSAGAQVIYSTLELKRRTILRDDTEIQIRMGGTGFGFGGTAAIAYRPIEDVTLGLNYRSAANIPFSGSAHFEGEQGTAFQNTFVDNGVETELTLPHFINTGIGWSPIDRLFLELDAQYITWSTYDRVVIDFQKDKPQETSTIVNNWRDAWALRFGASYEVIDRLPLRFGVAYDATPIPDATVNASLPGNNRLAGSLGLGYTTSGFRFDAGYQLVSALERNIDNGRAPSGNYKTTAHLLSLNVGYGY